MEIQLIIPSPPICANTTPHFPNYYYSAPSTPIRTIFQTDDDQDFAFDFGGHLDPPSISHADELFHCGQIKTTFPFSHRCKNKNPDYFTVAFYQTPGDQTQPTQNPPKRGRETTTNTTRTRDKASQSSSPFRISDYFTGAFYQTPGDQTQPTQNPPKRGRETTTDIKKTRGKASRSSSPFRISDILAGEDHNRKNSLTWYNKWNLKNLLLFRSASEGNKYSRIRKGDEDGCRSGVGRKVSPHEMHYTANRAVAEEMRRKTYLPYKSGLLGCLVLL